MTHFALYGIFNEERAHFDFLTEVGFLPEVFESEEQAQKRANELGGQYAVYEPGEVIL